MEAKPRKYGNPGPKGCKRTSNKMNSQKNELECGSADIGDCNLAPFLQEPRIHVSQPPKIKPVSEYFCGSQVKKLGKTENLIHIGPRNVKVKLYYSKNTKPQRPTEAEFPDARKGFEEWGMFLRKCRNNQKIQQWEISARTEFQHLERSDQKVTPVPSSETKIQSHVELEQKDMVTILRKRGKAKSCPVLLPRKIAPSADVMISYVWKNQAEKLESLLRKGADPDVKNSAACRPLHCACECGMINCVEILLKYGAEIDSEGGVTCRTGLHWASSNGHIDIVRFLLKSGADPFHKDVNNELPGAKFVCDVPLAKQKLIQKVLGKSRAKQMRQGIKETLKTY